MRGPFLRRCLTLRAPESAISSERLKRFLQSWPLSGWLWCSLVSSDRCAASPSSVSPASTRKAADRRHVQRGRPFHRFYDIAFDSEIRVLPALPTPGPRASSALDRTIAHEIGHAVDQAAPRPLLARHKSDLARQKRFPAAPGKAGASAGSTGPEGRLGTAAGPDPGRQAGHHQSPDPVRPAAGLRRLRACHLAAGARREARLPAGRGRRQRHQDHDIRRRVRVRALRGGVLALHHRPADVLPAAPRRNRHPHAESASSGDGKSP